MKNFILSFVHFKSFILFLLVSANFFAQSIENVDFRAEGKTIVVTYDFFHSKADTAINVELVFKDQQGVVITPKTISGDLRNVKPGESKRIVWNVLSDRAEISGKYQVWVDVNVAKKYPVDIEWVSIPAGTFTMGSPESEVDRHNSENQHQVTLSAFKMSKNEITFAQYDLFCETTGRAKPSDEGWGRGERPVINVTWYDATDFATWMGCRLPTEAEWEYACRAGSTSPFNTGSNLTTDQANYYGLMPYNNNAQGKYLEKTMPVGSYLSNAWGLNDMHGNVWEWCSDWSGGYSSSAQTNPTGPSSGSYRVYRGGGFYARAHYCRSAFRSNSPPSYSSKRGVGFRLVVAP
jgi:formylglycine-generating enzyme required for sulfatase activity